MRRRLRWIVMASALALAPTVATYAQTGATPQQISSHRNWSVYEVTDSRGRICYLASEPIEKSGNYSRRDPPAALVARLPGQPPTEEVSVQPGYSYLKGSAVEITIDGRPFKMFTDGEHAWARTAEEDRALINAMKAGARMQVRGTSVRNTYSLDTYSLAGFTAAYEAMRRACAN